MAAGVRNTGAVFALCREPPPLSLNRAQHVVADNAGPVVSGVQGHTFGRIRAGRGLAGDRVAVLFLPHKRDWAWYELVTLAIGSPGRVVRSAPQHDLPHVFQLGQVETVPFENLVRFTHPGLFGIDAFGFPISSEKFFTLGGLGLIYQRVIKLSHEYGAFVAV